MASGIACLDTAAQRAGQIVDRAELSISQANGKMRIRRAVRRLRALRLRLRPIADSAWPS